MDRRTFVQRTAVAASAAAIGGTLALPGSTEAQQTSAPEQGIPDAIQRLRPMPPAVPPITDEERLARIEKARRLMKDNDIHAMFLEPGSSMFYYTGVRWGLSERPFG